MNISVLILTLDEEMNLPGCLRSVKWSDDVVVFDSFSTDRTPALAREHDGRVFQHSFRDYGAQREAARTMIDYKHPWVLALDADERPEPDLIGELQEIAASGRLSPAAYRMRRKDQFMGKWIKHSTLYPSWFIRFYQPNKIRYEPRRVHEYPTIGGSIGELRGHLIHHNFSKGLAQWLARHNRYSDAEAWETLDYLAENHLQWSGLVNFLDPVARRRTLKGFSFRFPCRPLLRFIYMYFFRLGALDGLPGFHYCRLLAIYEYLIVLKIGEIRMREKGLTL